MAIHLAPLAQSRSRSSVAASDTTYHSFNDIELYEPASPPKCTASAYVLPVRASEDSYPTTVVSSPDLSRVSAQQHERLWQKQQACSPLEMRRQDSGYGSIPPRSSHSSRRRTSTTSSAASATGSASAPASTSGSGPRPRSRRPSIRRSTKSGPVARMPRSSAPSLYLSQALSQQTLVAAGPYLQSQQQPQTGYFYFPPLERPVTAQACQDGSSSPPGTSDHHHSPSRFSCGGSHPATAQEIPHHVFPPPPAEPSSSPPPAPLPQTTHYWTSDRTRRLEYAAIDAASRGVRGWVMRHIVPECFVPRARRRVAFDDDRGSVRRYRLELGAGRGQYGPDDYDDDDDDDDDDAHGSGGWCIGSGAGSGGEKDIGRRQQGEQQEDEQQPKRKGWNWTAFNSK